jgi:hypothetical protein
VVLFVALLQIFLTALETGCRIGEILSVQFRQLRWDLNELHDDPEPLEPIVPRQRAEPFFFARLMEILLKLGLAAVEARCGNSRSERIGCFRVKSVAVARPSHGP